LDLLSARAARGSNGSFDPTFRQKLLKVVSRKANVSRSVDDRDDAFFSPFIEGPIADPEEDGSLSFGEQMLGVL
jgi:hypothetical protein